MKKLGEELGPRGLRILAYPCNQFGYQEPGDAETSAAFVEGLGVKGDWFRLGAKINVNGPKASEPFLFLKKEAPTTIGWNFGAYFLVDKAGNVEVDRPRAGSKRAFDVRALDIPRRRVAATPRPRRGNSVETSRRQKSSKPDFVS